MSSSLPPLPADLEKKVIQQKLEINEALLKDLQNHVQLLLGKKEKYQISYFDESIKVTEKRISSLTEEINELNSQL